MGSGADAIPAGTGARRGDGWLEHKALVRGYGGNREQRVLRHDEDLACLTGYWLGQGNLRLRPVDDLACLARAQTAHNIGRRGSCPRAVALYKALRGLDRTRPQPQTHAGSRANALMAQLGAAVELVVNERYRHHGAGARTKALKPGSTDQARATANGRRSEGHFIR